MQKPMILAIDPGYDRVGWAVGKCLHRGKIEAHSFGCITTSKQVALEQRYLKLQKDLLEIIDTHSCNVLAIETLYFSKNTTTALKVSEARGVILATCAAKNLTIREYNPGTIKSAVTGNGRADKKAMAKMIQLQLKIPTEKVIDDAIDALGILLTHSLLDPNETHR